MKKIVFLIMAGMLALIIACGSESPAPESVENDLTVPENSAPASTEAQPEITTMAVPNPNPIQIPCPCGKGEGNFVIHNPSGNHEIGFCLEPGTPAYERHLAHGDTVCCSPLQMIPPCNPVTTEN